MHEGLQLNAGLFPDNAYLLQGELARKYDPAETSLLQKAYVLCIDIVHLGAGYERQGGKVQFQQAQVLYDEAIHPCIPCLECKAPGIFQFVVEEYGVKGEVNL